jgi:hypothetical protein
MLQHSLCFIKANNSNDFNNNNKVMGSPILMQECEPGETSKCKLGGEARSQVESLTTIIILSLTQV